MKKTDFSRLEALISSAQAGGFAAGGRAARRTASALSQQVSALEKSLGVRLLSRDDGKLVLTPAGRTLVGVSAPNLLRLDEAIEAVRAMARGSAGVVRLYADPIATGFLLPKISSFSEKFPEVQLDLTISAAPLDIIENRFDVGIRPLSATLDNLAKVLLTKVSMQVAASKVYLATHGWPVAPKDLPAERCLTLTRIPVWHFQKGNKRQSVVPSGHFSSNSSALLVSAAVHNMGFICVESTYLDRTVCREKISVVLEDWFNNSIELYAFRSSTKGTPQIVSKFIDHISGSAGESKT